LLSKNGTELGGKVTEYVARWLFIDKTAYDLGLGYFPREG
jgi:hypothetical protein